MEKLVHKAKQTVFHRLKLTKKELLTKNTFTLEFEIPDHLKTNFEFEAGQYVTLRYLSQGRMMENDYSMTSAPFEGKISLGIKISSEDSSTKDLYEMASVGDEIEISEPRGRFTLISKPHEFR